MTKNSGMAVGPRELLSTKQARLGPSLVSRTRKALKFMWLTVLGLKDLRNFNDVTNNLSVSILELQELLSKRNIIASLPQNLSFRVQRMHL
jgi:hypothetical protein